MCGLRGDSNWLNWGFPEFLEALRKYAERNSKLNVTKKNHVNCKSKLPQTKQNSPKQYIYWEASDHKASHCKKFKNVSNRKKILSSKKLCFDFTGKHRASECKSKKTCIEKKRS